METLTVEPDIDALLEDGRFDEHGCETTHHATNHQVHCGRAAMYLFTAYDEDCEKWIKGYLCGPCMPSIVRAAPLGAWCCRHIGHHWITIRTLGIGS